MDVGTATMWLTAILVIFGVITLVVQMAAKEKRNKISQQQVGTGESTQQQAGDSAIQSGRDTNIKK
jgi:hypothetical protein